MAAYTAHGCRQTPARRFRGSAVGARTAPGCPQSPAGGCPARRRSRTSLPLMFLSGSLAAPPATAGATTGAACAPTAAPAKPVRRIVAASFQQHPQRAASSPHLDVAPPYAAFATGEGERTRSAWRRRRSGWRAASPVMTNEFRCPRAPPRGTRSSTRLRAEAARGAPARGEVASAGRSASVAVHRSQITSVRWHARACRSASAARR